MHLSEVAVRASDRDFYWAKGDTRAALGEMRTAAAEMPSAEVEKSLAAIEKSLAEAAESSAFGVNDPAVIAHASRNAATKATI